MIFEDGAMVFYGGNRQVLPNHQNQPLCITSYVHDVELKRALIDLGYFLNIMPV